MTFLLSGLRVPALCVLTALIAIVSHEVGHAIAGYFTGSRVSSFVVFSGRPHVRLTGPSTPEQDAWRAAGGTAFFLAAWATWLLAAGTGATATALVRASSMVAFVESCGWFLSALLYPYGPRSEDGWKFLESSGLNRSIPAIAALLAGCVAVRFLMFRPATRSKCAQG